MRWCVTQSCRLFRWCMYTPKLICCFEICMMFIHVSCLQNTIQWLQVRYQVYGFMEFVWQGGMRTITFVTALMVCSHCLSPNTGTRTGKKWVVWDNEECFTLHRDWGPHCFLLCWFLVPVPGFGPGVSQCE